MTATLFGKLPAHGDFVARGLAVDEREALDAWLSAEMAGARTNADDAFEDAFDAAPVWRFARADGTAWRAGALALSVDASGRRFPVMFGWTSVPAGAVRAAAEFADTSLFSAICEGWDADRLASLEPPLADDPMPPPQGWWTDTADPTFTDLHPTGLLQAMLAATVAA